jgi:hypothetical protein
MNDRSHLSRQLGLLFAVAVLALASRWLLSGADLPEAPAAGEPDPAPVANDTPLRMAEASVAPVHAPARVPAPARAPEQARHPVRLGSPVSAESAALQAARPISAALCHALDERMRALDHQAAGKLPRHEQRRVRAERQRARELQMGLRCRAGADGYWF